MEMQMTLFPDPSTWASEQRRRSRPRRRRMTDGRGHNEESQAAHEAIRPTVTGRRAEIRCWLITNGPATDREIRDGLFGQGADMNMVRPRVTELLTIGSIIEEGRVRDHSTGMNVRQVRAF